ALAEQVGEQSLEHPEAFGSDGAGRPLRRWRGLRQRDLRSETRRPGLVPLRPPAEALDNLLAQLGRLERAGAAVLPQDPRREQPDVRVLRLDDAVRQAPAPPVRALDPPGGLRRHLDPGRADDVADLPGWTIAELGEVEVPGNTEVALAARVEADVTAHPGDA